MKIGLTYDLRREYLETGFTEEEVAEFDSEETIACLEEAIRGLGHETVRIGALHALARRLSAGERWDLVFNIAEGLYGRSREAQVPALLEGFGVPYTFSDPLTLALCLDKAVSKSVVRDAGILTPEFMTVSDPADLEESRWIRDAGFPLFVKPVSEGTGKGITTDSIVRDPGALKKQCSIQLKKYRQPVLVERYLPGREFTVGILGTDGNARVIGVLEVKLNENADPLVYSYENKELCEQRVEYHLVRDTKIIDEATDIALRAYRSLGCRDAGRLDLKADEEGRLFFLELNPLAGLHPTHSDLPILCTRVGISYAGLIGAIIESTLQGADERRQAPVRSGAMAAKN